MWKNKKTIAFKAAFPFTLPVMTGYLFLGAGFGILMSSKGIAVGWTVLMSVIVFAGSLQYVAITLMTAAFQPLYALLIAILINARHLFYGISMLERYSDTGRLKPYLVFGLTDETFSILATATLEDGVDRTWFYFFVTFLNQLYWIAGSLLGAVVGDLFRFNTEGLDFALTALFVVLFIEQWRQGGYRVAAVVGVVSSIAAILLFGQERFMIPAMILLLGALTFLRKSIEKREAESQ